MEKTAKLVAVTSLLILAVALAPLHAQSNTRLLLSTGYGVPGHPGFVFGPFSDLSMNDNRDIVFLSTLHSARNEIKAVVRSSGVSFTVVAFQGLLSPVPKANYDSFTGASINNAGAIALTATLKDSGEEIPAFAVIRVDSSGARAVATATDPVPGVPEAKFQEFSAPLINGQGDVLFGARWDGKKPGSGLFYWSAKGLQALETPAGMRVPPKTLLEPMFFSHDEAVFIPHGTPGEVATEQFFRAVATRAFQEIKPPPEPTDTVEILPMQAGQPPLQMLLVLMEGDNAQTAQLPGDPTQPVMARRPATGGVVNAFGRILGQTTGELGNIIFAAAPANNLTDFGLYCYCDGQALRQTSPEEFLAVMQSGATKGIASLASDGAKTISFIAIGADGQGASIYVTAIP